MISNESDGTTKSPKIDEITCENLHVKCGFEPWLKGPFFGGLSHGSKFNN